MKAKHIAFGTAILFVGGVITLANCGHEFLRQVGACDTTVSYLDLARQASEHRDYQQADEMFKRALIYARQNDKTGQAESAMLLTYAKFAYEKRHDKQLAMDLEARAQQLQEQAKASAQQINR